MKNLKTMNVQELSVQEMKKTDGGIWGWLLEGVAFAILQDAFANPSDYADKGNGHFGHMGGGRP